MTWYIKVGLALAAISLGLTALVFLGLFGFNPLQLPIIDRLTAASNTADLAAAVSAVTGISVAISTGLALALGVLGLIVLIENEKSETKSVEQLKLDIASLATTVLSVRDRALFYTQPGLVNAELDPFKLEREALTRVVTSSTGLAIYWWSLQPDNEDKDSLYDGIAGLVNATTFNLKTQFAEVAVELRVRSQVLFDEICLIQEPQFKRMLYPLSRLGSGLHHIRRALETDSVANFIRDEAAARAGAYRAPTKDELSALMVLADEKIGGKAGETVEHFGLAAISGTGEDRQRFHQLITQLLGVDLEGPASI